MKHLKNICENITEEQQRRANKVARDNGYGRATSVDFGSENKVISTIAFGYRKITTGEYVSNAYRLNFGWKNTYYESAECRVMITK